MEKNVEIEGIKIGLKVSAGTVRSYRDQFGRDLIQDMGQIEAEILANQIMTPETTKLAENIIYLMAREKNSDIGTIEEWLEQFSPYFIFNAITHVIIMWRENVRTLNKSKKKI